MSQSQHSPVVLKVPKQGGRAKGKPWPALWRGLEAREDVQRAGAGLGQEGVLWAYVGGKARA